MRTKKILQRSLFLILLFAAVTANASITGYTDRASFDAAVPGALIEDWDSYAAGTTIPNISSLNGINYGFSGIGIVTANYFNTTNPNSLGLTQIGQSIDYFTSADQGFFQFVGGISAFGIDINTYATAGGSYQIETNFGEIALSGYDPYPGLSTGQFVGFISDRPIYQVNYSVEPAGQNYGYVLDTMRYSPSAVSEPSTFLLLGAGLAGAGILRRRFKK